MAAIVVVGSGIGGLTASIYSRLAGHDVLVLEQQDGPGGKAKAIQHGPYRLDPGPSIVLLTEVYSSVFNDAGRRMEDFLQFVRLDPFSRVCLEGEAPIDLPADSQACLALLKQISQKDAASMQSLLDKMDKVIGSIEKTLFARAIEHPYQMITPGMARFAKSFPVFKPYKQWVDQHFESPLMRAFFYGFPSYSGQSFESAAPGALTIPYYMLMRGVYWPIGGIGAIPNALHRLAVDLGVEFRFNEQVSAWNEQGGRIQSITTANGERISGDSFISNRDRATVERELKKTREDGPKPSYSYFTLHLGVKRKVPLLHHHTLLIPRNFVGGFDELYSKRQFPEVPIVYINETSEIDPTTAPLGHSNVFCVVTSPAQEYHLNWDTLAATAKERTLAVLSRFGMEVSDVDLDFIRVQSPKTFADRDGNYLGSLYGEDESLRNWAGLLPDSRHSKLKNLFFCGGSVQPGAGMPMVALSGKFAARAASRI